MVHSQSGLLAARLDRRDDAEGCCLQGGATPQTCRQQFNRVRSALTQRVHYIKVKNVNFHKGLVKMTSGQLRNLG